VHILGLAYAKLMNSKSILELLASLYDLVYSCDVPIGTASEIYMEL